MIGHTGSGKSTLIQHLNGLIKPTSGTIYFDDEDIYSEGYPLRELRGKVGICFQYPEHQLFETTILDDVCFGPMNFGKTKEEATEIAVKLFKRMLDYQRNYIKNRHLNYLADRSEE